MIQYFITFDRENQLVKVKIEYKQINSDKIQLFLPLWRPGRYQAQNFPKNILNFSAKDENKELSWTKVTTHCWEVDTKDISNCNISYSYYANEINAGTSYVNASLIYINPVNLIMFRKEDFNQAFSLQLSGIDTDALVSCGLVHTRSEDSIAFSPQDYYHIFDSPIIISKDLVEHRFKVYDIPFHFWIYGQYSIDIEKLLSDLQQTAKYQIDLFGEFPEKEYHYQLIIPTFSYYHGVEHRNSTVMVLSDNGWVTEESYNELLGLASHELFHCWNIVKIRPQELLPYDYTRENYFTTCFVAEGFTTYFGDRTLYDSGVFTTEEYRHELETLFRRHFEKHDHASQSLLESSFDLWVDGYEPGVPNKKVSVYHKGAIITLILDTMIKEKFQGKRSMEDVMKALYKEFGDLSKGYTYEDIIRVCETVYDGDLKDFFKEFVAGNMPVFDETKKAVKSLNMVLSRNEGIIRVSL